MNSDVCRSVEGVFQWKDSQTPPFPSESVRHSHAVIPFFSDDISSKSAPATSATPFFKSEAPASRASHLEVRPTSREFDQALVNMILSPANLATTSMCLTHVFNRMHSIYLLAAHDTMTHDLGASMHVKGLQVRSIKHSSLAAF